MFFYQSSFQPSHGLAICAKYNLISIISFYQSYFNVVYFYYIYALIDGNQWSIANNLNQIKMVTSKSTILINATKQKVWDALTKPELVKKWQYGSDVITDWKVGSEIRFRVEWEDKVFEQWGKILEIIPNELIKYSLFFPRPDLEDKEENYFIMSYIISESENKIKLQILKEDNRPRAVKEEESNEENPVLLALKEIIESNQ
jgi:uncharacterized protein YndB with AHSA1/START domain